MKHSKKNLIAIIILGRAGSGKGTQAKLLVDKLGLGYFGTGESLRKRKKKKDFTGRKVGKVIARGELIPSFIVCNIWTDMFEDFKRRGLPGVILDGSPKGMDEKELIDEALDWYEFSKVKVLLIDISAKESFNRLTRRRQCKNCKRLIPWVGEFKKLRKCDKCGGDLILRADDNPAAIRERLEFFKTDVMPVMRDYKKQGKLVRINGEQSIEDVSKDILKALGR